jgi:2-oxoglutarate dehydrogenase E2 component (dihydrolipoamide succinyltransferase)
MKKKMKRFEGGGSIDADVRARAMKSVEGLEGIKGSDIEDETGTAKGSVKRNEYGDLYDSEMKTPVPKKTAEKLTPKAAPKAEPKAEPKEEPKAEPKKKASTTIPSTFGKVSLPKSFSASGGNTEPKKSTAKFSPPSISLPDPLAKFKKMASGGKVSSASKRADGCAIRGKTRA